MRAIKVVTLRTGHASERESVELHTVAGGGAQRARRINGCVRGPLCDRWIGAIASGS